MSGRNKLTKLTEKLSSTSRAGIEEHKFELHEEMAMHELLQALGGWQKSLAG